MVLFHCFISLLLPNNILVGFYFNESIFSLYIIFHIRFIIWIFLTFLVLFFTTIINFPSFLQWIYYFIISYYFISIYIYVLVATKWRYLLTITTQKEKKYIRNEIIMFKSIKVCYVPFGSASLSFYLGNIMRSNRWKIPFQYSFILIFVYYILLLVFVWVRE